jgi:hypothetical protein
LIDERITETLIVKLSVCYCWKPLLTASAFMAAFTAPLTGLSWG